MIKCFGFLGLTFWKFPRNFIIFSYEINVQSIINVLLGQIGFNSSSQTGFNMSGQQKIQTLVKVRQGQYKTFLLLWLFYFMSCSRDMAQNVKLSQKMKTEKTEKRWFFLKDDDHRWLFDNQSVGGYYWKTAKTWHFVTQSINAR